MSFAAAAAQQVAVASQFFDVGEMSATYHVSRRSVFRLADQGVLPKGIRLGGRRLWPRSVVEEHLARLATAAT
jgi:predicted DNA-binding transcriptional regulator AlpA